MLNGLLHDRPAAAGRGGAGRAPPAAPRRLALLLAPALALLAGCQSLLDAGSGPRGAGRGAAEPVEIVVEAPIAARAPAIRLEALPDPSSDDLLARLRSEFSLPAASHAEVTAERDWYAAHPEYLDRVLGRARLYLYHIAEALDERGMPSDLALLPIVESAFDPFAYSHGRASGLWQIIPGTGRYLGLEQNWWVDGRRDVVDSTRAALDYLEELHEQFGGDWLLAVAGYNSGAGNVRRALRRAEADGKPTDFWGIRSYLPRETRAYVPRLLAIRDLFAAPETHGVELLRLPNEPYFASVDTGAQIDMVLAAELAGLEVDELYRLNPGVNRWATPPEGPHRLLVPAPAAERLTAALDELGERERVQWTRHRIEPGETLGALANRYNTTVDMLREVNGVRGNRIRAGDHLMVPHALAAGGTYTQTVAARTARQQNRERAGSRRVHVVSSGESLWSISRRYGVNVRALASWNAMAPGDTLGVGRELVVWGGSGAAAGAPAVVPTAAILPASALVAPQVRQVNYVVRRGDSLSSIGRRFRVSIAELLEWNGLDADDYLQPGQRLTLYVDVTEQSS